MSKNVPGYTPAELEALAAQAESFLGKRIIFEECDVDANPAAGVKAKTLSTRGQVALAVTQVKFFPTQDTKWQHNIQNFVHPQTGESEQRDDRQAGQIFSNVTQGHPLFGVILPRSATATSDPLATLTRLTAVFPNDQIEEDITWKALLTHPRMRSSRLDAKQMSQFARAVNWQNCASRSSPVRITNLRGDFDAEKVAPPTEAHRDLKAVYNITADAREKLIASLQRILQGEIEG